MKINSILKSVLVVFAFVLVSAMVMVSCKSETKVEDLEDEATEVIEDIEEAVEETLEGDDTLEVEEVEEEVEEE